ncbi:MAG: MscL family protein, partial [Lachnospiraceae bacterium]|nr:MscL family protein [Lachnospiraceae bacterium]
AFISAVINFLLIALVIFCLIKSINKFKKKQEEEAAEPTTKECPFCCETISIKATKCPHCGSELK